LLPNVESFGFFFQRESGIVNQFIGRRIMGLGMLNFVGFGRTGHDRLLEIWPNNRNRKRRMIGSVPMTKSLLVRLLNGTPHNIKVKNPKARAVKREAEEDWGR
jgi:hypothetical protein